MTSLNYVRIMEFKKDYMNIDNIINNEILLNNLENSILMYELLDNSVNETNNTYQESIKTTLLKVDKNSKEIDAVINDLRYNHKNLINEKIYMQISELETLKTGLNDDIRKITSSNKSGLQALSEAQNKLDKMKSMNREVYTAIKTNFEKMLFRLSIIVLINFLITIAACIFLIFYLRKSVFNPLDKIADNFKTIAEYYFGRDFKVKTKDEIGRLMNNFNKLRSKLTAVEELSQKINMQHSFEDVFDYLFNNFKPFIPYDRIGIAVLDETGDKIYALSAKSNYPIKLGNRYSMPLEKTSLKKVIRTQEPRIINDLEQYLSQKPYSESTKLIVDEGMRSSITLPLIVKDDCVGVIFFSSTNKNTYTKSHVSFLKYIAQHIAISFDKGFLQEELIISTINGFAKLVEAKDNETGLHLERMRSYASLIVEKLGETLQYKRIINNKFKREIYNFSPVHDIGKVGIPDKILLKTDKLTDEEFKIMKTHTLIGANILTNMERELKREDRAFYKTGIEIAKYHHERYDGNGYPEGLKGEEIPLSARIVAIADVFDALTSERPYKKAFSPEESFDIIKAEAGKHFDPFIVETFIQSKDEVVKIYERFKRIEKKQSDVVAT